jgi:hypothetical protein
MILGYFLAENHCAMDGKKVVAGGPNNPRRRQNWLAESNHIYPSAFNRLIALPIIT